MRQNFIDKVKQFDMDLFASYRKKRFEEVEGRLHELRDLAEEVDEIHHVLGMLVNHYHYIEDAVRAKHALEERIQLAPEQVEGWLGLAEHFHCHEIDLNSAAKNIDIALQKAVVHKELVRQVLGVRIRIALAQKNFDAVSDSLLLLLDYKLPEGSFDVALEYDFISQIPPHSVNDEILNRYKMLANFKN